MKIFEKIIGKKIRKVIDVSEIQLRFMLGKGTVDSVFITCQLQEKYLGKKEKPLFHLCKFGQSILESLLGHCKMGYDKAKCG